MEEGWTGGRWGVGWGVKASFKLSQEAEITPVSSSTGPDTQSMRPNAASLTHFMEKPNLARSGFTGTFD